MTDWPMRKWMAQVEKPGWEGYADLEVWAKSLEEATDRLLLELNERDRLVMVRQLPDPPPSNQTGSWA